MPLTVYRQAKLLDLNKGAENGANCLYGKEAIPFIAFKRRTDVLKEAISANTERVCRVESWHLRRRVARNSTLVGQLQLSSRRGQGRASWRRHNFAPTIVR